MGAKCNTTDQLNTNYKLQIYKLQIKYYKRVFINFIREKLIQIKNLQIYKYKLQINNTKGCSLIL